MHDDKVQFLDIVWKLESVKDQRSNIVADCSKLWVRNGGSSFSEYWLNSDDLQQTLAIRSQLAWDIYIYIYLSQYCGNIYGLSASLRICATTWQSLCLLINPLCFVDTWRLYICKCKAASRALWQAVAEQNWTYMYCSCSCKKKPKTDTDIAIFKRKPKPTWKTDTDPWLFSIRPTCTFQTTAIECWC